jgi:hypothetical protein
MKTLLRGFMLVCLYGAGESADRKLLVLSVDGLDHRYLKDCDRLGLRIPNLRRLMREGAWADGVVGEIPTITWPSHTTLLTGVAPPVHGILGNQRPKAEGGSYYWSVDLLHARTLWDAMREAGRTTAAITWPVTVDAPITWNLPEYFVRRNGGAMDLKSIAAKGTPGLAEAIARRYPSFPQQWMDDRTRTLALLYLLEEKRPDLTGAHGRTAWAGAGRVASGHCFGIGFRPRICPGAKGSEPARPDGEGRGPWGVGSESRGGEHVRRRGGAVSGAGADECGKRNRAGHPSRGVEAVSSQSPRTVGGL